VSSKKARQRARRQAARKQAAKKKASARGPEGRGPEGKPAKTEAPSKEESRRPDAQTPVVTKKAERLEKRESARQSRIEAARRRQRAKRRKRLLAVILVAVVVGSVAVFFVARAAQNRDRYNKERTDAGCNEIRLFDEQTPQHIDAQSAPPRVPYNSDPPTSGDHAGSQVAPWDIFDETLPPETFVHNLEHGGTVIHYKGLSDENIERLEAIIEDNPDTVLMMPNETVTKPIVLTAWRAMQTCERVNTFVIEEFIKRRCNKSPEPGSDCGSGGGGGGTTP
jgi:hypothetical protein